MSEISRIYYNKLVRDSIPARIEAKGEHCGVREITDVQEFQQELFKKIKEEAASLLWYGLGKSSWVSTLT